MLQFKKSLIQIFGQLMYEYISALWPQHKQVIIQLLAVFKKYLPCILHSARLCKGYKIIRGVFTINLENIKLGLHFTL